MKRVFPPFVSPMFRVAKLIGRKEFPAAIRMLEEHLIDDPSDLFSLMMLAECYHWSGSDDKAIQTASRILQYDANDFSGLRLLSEIYARREEKDRAAEFVRRALENFPQPIPHPPRMLISVAKFFARILPPLRHMQARDFDPNTSDREWFDWAKRYLAWYDGATGGNASPVLH